MNNRLLDYLERVEVIHVKSRIDRYRQIVNELNSVGIDVGDDRVRFPDPFMADSSNGFSSKQVYGNFVSHLDILERALNDKCSSVMILEDDAIFRSSLWSDRYQCELIDSLKNEPWDILFLGHPLSRKLKNQKSGLIETSASFKWAHCYVVSASALPGLVEYLKECITRPAGHPDGGKMYIDGALNMYRARSSGVKTLLHNPALSVQRGSPSGIANQSWYDKHYLGASIVRFARYIRDEVWRRTGFFGTK